MCIKFKDNERFCEPNLIKTRLKRAFISALMPETLVNELRDMGVITHKLGCSPNLHSELAYHPDILLNNYRKGMWMCEYNPKYLPKEFDHKMFYESENELSDLYPYDCLFNNFKINNTLFCGKSADRLIKSFAVYEEVRIVYVPQNYVKCCCVIVNEKAIITSDKTIAKTLRYNNYDVLLIPDSTTIGLRGFSHGLIGGCAVNISHNLIGFTGNLNKFEFGKDIRAFCDNYKIDTLSLTNGNLYDYGGILPITEIIPYNELSTNDNGFIL